MEAPTRRSVLRVALAIPGALGLGWAAGRMRSGARVLRPAAAGTSSGRCARCGGTDHTMLSPRCPDDPGVLR